MDFPSDFRAWLASALQAPVPNEVRAFSFNLFEPALINGVKFGVELIGAEQLDPQDSDWGCEEIWAAQPRKLLIPISFSTQGWEKCFQEMKALLQSVLDGDSHISNVLKSKQAVALGFVDGDLVLVWSA